MKIKFLMISLLGLISVTAFAQKGALKDAQESYDSYDVAKGQTSALIKNKAKSDLADAKTAIDKAATNDKTATLPQTYALKGAIYGALAVQDSVPTTSAPLLATSQEAIKKAKEADTKGEFKKLIDEGNFYAAVYYQTAGVKEYQTGKYELAYQSFDNWSQATGDTTAMYYAGLAASNAGNTNPKFYPNAIASYNKLLATNYSQNAKIYGYLATLYIVSKDTANALKTVNAAVNKYPENTALREQEIKFSLMAGKDEEIVGKLESAVAADPKNKELCYFAGLAYTRIGDANALKAEKTKDAATKSPLNKAALENYAKAADFYNKAIAIDPNYADANLNLGEVMMKPAIDVYNQAANLPSNATQKQYDDIRLKADVLFNAAKPYLQKAVDLNPKSSAALTNLWTYYRAIYDPAHAADNKAKAADLKKQIDALPAGSN